MKNGILFLLFSLFTLSASAQDAFEGTKLSPIKVNLGLKGGVNLSQLNGDNWEGGYKANLLGGVFVSVMGNRMGVQAEGNFLQSQYITGKTFYDAYSQYYNNAVDSAKEGSFRVNYLSIPVLFQIKVLPRVRLQVGPQYSGIVSVNDKEELLKDAEGLFRKGAVEAVGGLWFTVTKRINAGARYVLGLTDVNETAVNEAWKSRNVQLHIGLTF